MTDSSSSTDQRVPANLDTTVAHTARVWNYWLGGKDNFGPDREVGDQIQQMLPGIVTTARADRGFLQRAVRFVTDEAGMRQFLDIGTGLPTAGNTHEVAQSIAPEARIVYVDNDPLVLVHARALLSSAPQGATDYIDADLHDPEKILEAAARTLDFSKPVALTLLGVLNFILDEEEALAIVHRLLDAVPSGSYLVIAHASNEVKAEEAERARQFWNANAKPPIVFRTARQIARFFDRVELLEPGVVSCSRWRPEPADLDTPADVNQFCGVGRKP
ncbi:MAG TPA: SAM-dependent methyltransferase [Pilimelia sp.]|nr:SAM-dependent methyltransferase [Pilimelia sp.]